MEGNSATAAGSDGRFYVLGAPSWKDASFSGANGFTRFAEGGNGVIYTDNDGPMMWDGTDWVEIPGLPAPSIDCYTFAAHPVNGDLYCLGYGGDPLRKWDGSDWELLTTDSVGTVYDMAVDSEGHVHVVGDFYFQYMSGNCYNYAEFSYGSWSCSGGFDDEDWVSDIAINSYDQIFVGGEFDLDGGARNLVSMNGGSINGVSGQVYDIAIGEDNTVYVTGDFTATLDYLGNIDQTTDSGIVAWDSGSFSWVIYPLPPDPDFPPGDYTVSSYNAFSLAETSGDELYAAGRWWWSHQISPSYSEGGSYGAFTRWNGTAWEKLGQSANDSNNSSLDYIAAT
jgi:hypothetical protein